MSARISPVVLPARGCLPWEGDQERSNPYEGAARAAKLAKLIDAADAIASEGGLHPRLHAAGIAESWKNAKAVHFEALIRRAQVRPPSSVTLEQFYEALEHRAEMAGAA